jgi:hypothetical protein
MHDISASASSPSSLPASASESPPSALTPVPAPAEWALPFAPVAPRRPKKRRNRSGWGPFRSVVRERSAAFNLTLDVQQLQQEVQALTAVRDALLLKSLNLRHAPDGSLMRTVREYFRLFRRGYRVDGDPPRLEGDEAGATDGLVRESEQRAFIFSAMDEALDCGNGLFGPQVMVEQNRNYSNFLRYIAFELESFDIVAAEDSVIITTRATLRFQILRMTIAMIFPHILGNEGIVARLVGQELAPVGTITFYFNAKGKCEKYTAELDFAELLFGLLDDPKDVDVLMGRALIADNSMLGLDQPSKFEVATDVEDRVENNEDACVAIENLDPETSDSGTVYSSQEYDMPANYTAQQPTQVPGQRFDWAVAPNSDSGSEGEQPSVKSSRVSLSSIVDEYFAVFGATSSVDNHGYVRPLEVAHDLAQREFVSTYFAGNARIGGDRIGPQGVLHQWEILRSVFHVASFRQTAPNSVMYDPVHNSYVIRTTAEYRLQSTLRTIGIVFPHVHPQSPAASLLLSQQLVVQSDLAFFMTGDVEKVTRMTERLDIRAAVAAVVQNPDAQSQLLSEARISKDGQLLLDAGQKQESVGHFSF